MLAPSLAVGTIPALAAHQRTNGMSCHYLSISDARIVAMDVLFEEFTQSQSVKVDSVTSSFVCAHASLALAVHATSA